MFPDPSRYYFQCWKNSKRWNTENHSWRQLLWIARENDEQDFFPLWIVKMFPIARNVTEPLPSMLLETIRKANYFLCSKSFQPKIIIFKGFLMPEDISYTTKDLRTNGSNPFSPGSSKIPPTLFPTWDLGPKPYPLYVPQWGNKIP